MRVIGFVAVYVDQASGALGQVHQELHRTHTLIAGVLEMRGPADHVRAHADGFFHQLSTIAERLDAFCGRDDLQVDQVSTFFAHFEHGLECGELRVGDVDVGAHVLDAMRRQGLNGFLAGSWCLLR